MFGSRARALTRRFGVFGTALFAATALAASAHAQLAITSPATLRPATRGVAYAQAFAASGGTSPYTWTVIAGALPSGLALDSLAGTLAGTPDSAGVSGFTLQVIDAASDTASAAFAIAIAEPLVVTTSSLPHAITGVAYAESLAATGGFAPLTWSLTAGTLPGGLTLDGASGAIGGTPVAAGTAHLTFTVTDSAGSSTAAALDLTVDCQAIAIAPATLPQGSLGSAYSQALAASAGVAPFTFTLASGALPSGVTLSAGGTIAGTPGAAGSFPVSIQVTDADGCGTTQPFTLTVLAIPTAIADLAAAMAPAGNGSGGTTGIVVTFTAPAGAASVEVYRAGFGHYPAYDDSGGAVPPTPTYPPGAPWALTAIGASGQVDTLATRDFWYYVAFAKNALGAVSPVSNRTGGTLDYILGDVSNGWTPGTGNNVVGIEDISLLGANYGIDAPQIAARNVGFLDVGPTTDLQLTSRPFTDGHIDFEDFIVFADDYLRNVTAPAAARLADLAGAAASAPESFRLEAPALVEPGTVVTATLHLAAAGRLQGFAARLRWDPDVVEPLDVTPGHFVADQGGLVLSPGPGRVDAALLGIREHGIAGAGEVATLRFRVRRAGDAAIALAEVTARDAANRPLAPGALASATAAAAPLATVLLATGPNPFHGSAPLLYSLAHAGPVQLDVFAVDGRRVRALAGGVQPAGVVHLAWDGRDDHGDRVGPGVYYVHMVAGGLHFTRKLVFLP